MGEKIKYVQYGLGPIGAATVRFAAQRENVELVGAIDIDPEKIGRDAGEVVGLDALGVSVEGDADRVLAVSGAEIVVLTTVSNLERLEEQLVGCLRAGKNVVSSTEELAWPWETSPAIAGRLDEEARRAGVSVLGTGVNPGFLMDALPLMLTGVCRDVESVRVERHQDAAMRRLPFQRKIGAGLDLADFEAKVKAGLIRHVGFTESIRMIAASLGWKLDRTEDKVEAAVADRELRSRYLTVEPGQVAGVIQAGRGFIDDRPVITLELQAYLGHPHPRDAVIIHGDPPVHSVIEGGVNGDIATGAMLVNAMPRVIEARPGLISMRDVGLISWFSGR